MTTEDSGKGFRDRKVTGLEINCHKCGRELPLLHPHIMVERLDEDENLICEVCYEELCPDRM